MQNISQVDVDFNIKTKLTNINGRYHARLFVNDKLFDEMACDDKRDIGLIFRIMFRWANKIGIVNEHTESVRNRYNKFPEKENGKIYYTVDLEQ